MRPGVATQREQQSPGFVQQGGVLRGTVASGQWAKRYPVQFSRQSVELRRLREL